MPKRRKSGVVFIDKRVRAAQAPYPEKAIEQLKAHSSLRLMADGAFSLEELDTLREKIRGYQASGEGRVWAS